jgi:hypothetical protein
MRCVHSPSRLHLGSFAFVFTVPHVCIWGPLCLCSRSLAFAFVALCLWLRICGLVFVALCLWLCICVRSLVFVFVFAIPRVHICGLVFVFVFVVPCVRVRVHNWPLAFVVFTTAPSLALTGVGYI